MSGSTRWQIMDRNYRTTHKQTELFAATMIVAAR